MKAIVMKHLDLTVYTETLKNGLQIYVVPKNNCNNIQATFTTKYGSNQSEFVPLGQTEMIQVPDGVAHFLEHKLFEQEDGTDPFDFFDSNGSECNASTNPWKTQYWFSGTQAFEQNMNFLLDFVQKPYFTKKSVQKEKGIIQQEITMYQDDPYRIGFEKSNYNTFIEHPIRIPTGGTKESVDAITKEDLYTCYYTFYHPSNMIVVVTGNVDAEKTIALITKNQSQKEFKPAEKIVVKEYNEPDEVRTEKEIIEMNVTIPKIFRNYKLNVEHITLSVPRFLPLYLSIFVDLKIGSTSSFIEKLKQEEIIHDDLYFGTTQTRQHILLTVEGETEKIEELITAIDHELENKKISEADFNRKKKTILSSCIFMSDNIYRMNNRIVSDLIKDGEVHYDVYEDYKGLNFDDFKRVIDEITWDHKNVVVIQPKASSN